MITLTEQQDSVLKKIKQKNYCICVARTGWGKAYVGLKWVLETQEQTFIICPAHLIPQWSELLKNQGIGFGIYDEKHIIPSNKVVLFSMQKLSLHYSKVSEPKNMAIKGLSPEKFNQQKKAFKDYKIAVENFKDKSKNANVIIDEFHRATDYNSELFGFIKKNKFKNYLLTSATPIDGSYLNIFSAIRLIHYVDLTKEHGIGFKNITEFKKMHCIVDEYDAIQEIKQDAINVLKSFCDFFNYENDEEKLTNQIEVIIDLPKKKIDFEGEEKSIVGLINQETFIKKRQILNGFIYKDNSVIQLFDNEKIKIIDNILFDESPKKVLIFYDFIEEREQLKSLSDIMFYKKYEDIETFKNNDKQALAVHFKSLGEGIRLKFVDVIIFFSFCMSVRTMTQAKGRALFARRKDKITVYRLKTNTTFERKLQKMIDLKEQIQEGLWVLSKEELIRIEQEKQKVMKELIKQK